MNWCHGFLNMPFPTPPCHSSRPTPTHPVTYVHTHAPTHLHTYVHTHAPTHLHTYVHTHVPTHLHTYVHTHARTHSPTHAPTHLHTHARAFFMAKSYWSNALVSCAFIGILHLKFVESSRSKTWLRSIATNCQFPTFMFHCLLQELNRCTGFCCCCCSYFVLFCFSKKELYITNYTVGYCFHEHGRSCAVSWNKWRVL